MKVLIPGIAGHLARKVAVRLLDAGHEVSGIDARPWTLAPRGITHVRVDIRKRAAEDVFRKFRPDAVIHMATVTSLAVQGEERHRINLGGTRAVFEHCRAYGVKQLLFVGRHTFYGAGPDSPLYHREDEPPQSLSGFPELVDLVAADLYAATELWRAPEITTAVLRLCYTLGESGHGTLATFLRGRYVPQVLGYDPLFQFIHEDDAVSAICLALEKRLRGIYNVAGPQPVPLSLIAKKAGRRVLPLPGFVLQAMLGRGGIPNIAPGALGHIKYPVVVDAALFRKETGFDFDYDEVQTIAAFREAFPPP